MVAAQTPSWINVEALMAVFHPSWDGDTVTSGAVGPGTAASEFFISIGENAELDFGGARNPDGQGFAAFGKVVEGMDVVRTIQSGETGASLDGDIMAGQLLDAPVKILSARRD